MKKLGFTLIELLAVIVIIAIILLIAVPKVIDIIDSSKEESYNNQVDMIEDAARIYTTISDNVQTQLNESGTYNITLQDLVDSGFLDKLPIDPRDNTEFPGTSVIVINMDENNNLVFEYNYSEPPVDTDGDGVMDSIELANGRDPELAEDTDGDNLYDDYEIIVLKTSPLSTDTDYDGVNDDVDDDPLVYVDSDLGTLEEYSENLFLIGSVEDLVQWNKDLNNLDGDLGLYELSDSYILVNDVDMATLDTDNDDTNGNWNSVGESSASYFNGDFDGTNHVIKNINIISTVDYSGFFGYVSSSTSLIKDIKLNNITVSGVSSVGTLAGYFSYGETKNIEVKNVVISGNSYVGGIVGYRFYGDDAGLKASGTVTASSNYAGGLMGNLSYGVHEGIAAVDVTGADYVGGLFGRANASLSFSCTIRGAVIGGSVTGTGENVRRSFYSSSSYLNKSTVALNTILVNGAEVTGTSLESTYGKDITLEDIDQISMCEYVGMDSYIGGDNNVDGYYWDYGTGELAFKSIEDEPLTFSLSGTGTVEDPYLISNATQLKQASLKLDENYKLTTNIDYNNEKFYSLGSYTNDFSGVFDGGGFSISNITLESPGTSKIGIFGQVDSGFELQDITFDNITLRGLSSVGVVGYAYYFNSIKNIELNNINIESDSSGGSLGGYLREGLIRNVVADNFDIIGRTNLGGIVGYRFYGDDAGLKASGTVTASLNYAGGLMGNLSYGVHEGIAAVDVTGADYVGGLFGRVNASLSSSCTIRGAVIGGSVTGTRENVRRSFYSSSSYLNKSTLALNSILVNGGTVTSTSLNSTYGKDMTLLESQTLSTYDQIGFETGSDINLDGYYWDIVDNEITLIEL